jgi:hypothetical protein
MSNPKPDLAIYPGGDLVSKGLNDLGKGQLSIEALLVLVASPRLTALGFEVSKPRDAPKSPEHALYEMLESIHDRGAHSEYNALIRRIVSFAQSYEQQLTRSSRRTV